MPNITDVLNEYNSEHGALRGSSVATALKETLSTINQTVIEAGEELPEVATIDAGKVLKVNAAGHWVVDTDDDNELPTVTSADAGKALVVNDQGEWEAGNVSTPEPKVFNCYTDTASSTAVKVIQFSSGKPVPTQQELIDGALLKVTFLNYNSYNGTLSLSVTTSDGQTMNYEICDTLGKYVDTFKTRYDTSLYSTSIPLYYIFKFARVASGTYYYNRWMLIDTDPTGLRAVTSNSTATSYTKQYRTFNYPLVEVPSFSTSDANKILSVSSNGSALSWVARPVPTVNSGDRYKYLYSSNGTPVWMSIDQLPSSTGQTSNILAVDYNGGSPQPAWINYTNLLRDAVPKYSYWINDDFDGFTDEYPWCPMVPHPGQDYVDGFGQSVLCSYVIKATSDSVRTNFLDLLIESQVLGGFYVDFLCDNGVGIPIYNGQNTTWQRVHLMPDIKYHGSSTVIPRIATTGYSYSAQDVKTVIVSFMGYDSGNIENYLITFGYEIIIPGSYSSNNKPSFAFTVFRMTDLSGNPIVNTSFLSAMYIAITFPAMSSKGNIDWSESWESVENMFPDPYLINEGD